MKIQKHFYLLAVLLMVAAIAGLAPSVANAEGTLGQVTLSISADKETASAGDNVTFTYIVTNTGTTAVDNLTITDNRTGSILLSDTSLGVGDNATGTVIYAVQESDLPGPLHLNLVAAGIEAAGDNITAVASYSVELKANNADDEEDDEEEDVDGDEDMDNDDAAPTKAQILKSRGVPGKGIDHAPGLQKPFNRHMRAAHNGWGHDKIKSNQRGGLGNGRN